ncbi:secretory lipase-domain-containing protein [Diplogelasinospora grovesii]|uniref:Secretory lipase-domain-containing protein n=1 Tax=Diplogelasinospora grovesii TaxID=303347 RepID=A0AAN6N892_9PEZI|nr:secretory lipase-domain-containing protein [Diplogelasinospora grovesii]
MALLIRLLLAWSVLTPPISLAATLKSLETLVADADAGVDALPMPLPPSLDPWYRAPDDMDWEDSDPGTVLKIRHAPRLNQTVGNALTAYHVLYRSTDSEYNPSWDVTTLFIPLWQYRCSASAPALCAHALLSYQIPYDTCNVDASPSFGLHVGEPYGEISDALSLGWFVAVPDYEGPLASYAAGVQAGHATLDGVRAVLRVAGLFGLRTHVTKVALWGYSGGALASEWAAELSVQYAPKLNVAGIALGGLTPNVTSVTDFINGRECAGLIPAGLLGIASQHPAAMNWMLSRLKPTGPYNAATFLSVRHLTAAQSIALFRYQNMYNYFVGGWWDIHVPRVMRLMYDVDGYMGYHGVPRMPVFVYKAIHDELSRVEDTDALVNRFCGVGANILYHRNTAGGHNQELVNGRQRAFTWLASILDGSYDTIYSAMGCTIVNVTYDLTPFVPWD